MAAQSGGFADPPDWATCHRFVPAANPVAGIDACYAAALS